VRHAAFASAKTLAISCRVLSGFNVSESLDNSFVNKETIINVMIFLRALFSVNKSFKQAGCVDQYLSGS
jgi:hypothetical protein